jgi:hypothetical protein
MELHPTCRRSPRASRRCRANDAVPSSPNKPIGVAEYQLVDALPKELETSLPSIAQIERELRELGK